ncbi:amino acid aminotransferase [Candidatus Aerophobetes bacterium]|uniref:Amino acid aminotransferase n=1 Tax=Aerophobetes bacterium TaxID=2030807 RepID=A0A2A4YDB5_UNCAE|nr:MAG: amino acid aminotransferase [Candidatus Aerophobetes bacterium]
MSYFEHLELLPPDPILSLTWAFKKEKNPHKVDLSVGIYHNANLDKEILKCVKKAEEALLKLEIDKAYLPVEGNPVFIKDTEKLIFGSELAEQLKGRIIGAQTPGGTGALRMGGEFLKYSGLENIAFPSPTWANHPTIFNRCKMKADFYPYYCTETNSLEFDKMMPHLKKLPKKTVILLHACCHNPTGCDLSKEQWNDILTVVKKNGLLPFFDSAYQGLGDNLNDDAYGVRLFARSGIEMLVAYSFSKILGLYGERTGAVFAILSNEKVAKNAATNLKLVIRGNYSNPPRHGGAIASYIFNHPELKNMWRAELSIMQRRITEMRHLFTTKLVDAAKIVDYRHIQDRKGMFCYTGLRKSQVARLKEEYGIYMPGSGRVNVTGLNEDNVHYVVDAIINVTEKS